MTQQIAGLQNAKKTENDSQSYIQVLHLTIDFLRFQWTMHGVALSTLSMSIGRPPMTTTPEKETEAKSRGITVQGIDISEDPANLTSLIIHNLLIILCCRSWISTVNCISLCQVSCSVNSVFVFLLMEKIYQLQNQIGSSMFSAYPWISIKYDTATCRLSETVSLTNKR